MYNNVFKLGMGGGVRGLGNWIYVCNSGEWGIGSSFLGFYRVVISWNIR